MNDFEKWFRSLNANGKTVYFLGNEHKVSEMAWNRQQAIIDDLKAQLNNMEQCYIGKKKQVEDALHILDELYRKGLFAKPKAVSEAIKVLRGEHE